MWGCRMEYIKLCDICDFQGGSQPPKDEWSFEPRDGYIRMLQIRDFTQGERVTPEYIKITKTTKVCKADDILIARYGASLGKILTGLSGAYNVAIMRTIPNTKLLEKKYLYYYLKSSTFQTFLLNIGNRAAQAGFNKKDLEELRIPNISREAQCEIVSILERVEAIISTRQQQLQKLDDLVKARFVEMFGDLKSNPMEWPVVPFTEFAKIDGNMTTDYEKYADYPHIGIDSIEKGTGALKGYRTVREDGVISGKYIFTPQHIIYSKIRPNLNKVALPDFEGLCSADAYPILPNHSNCNRVFLAIALRSEYFLEYILQFSSRTNLPKVNRKEIVGFCMPLPPIELQQQFAAFAAQADQSKSALQRTITSLQETKRSLAAEALCMGRKE